MEKYLQNQSLTNFDVYDIVQKLKIFVGFI